MASDVRGRLGGRLTWLKSTHSQSEFDDLQARVYDLERKIELLVSVVAYRGNNDVWLKSLAEDVQGSLWRIAEADFMEFTRCELKVEPKFLSIYDVQLLCVIESKWTRLHRSKPQFEAAFRQAAETSFVRQLRNDIVKVHTVVRW